MKETPTPPFALSLSKGCISAPPCEQKVRAALRQAQGERGGDDGFTLLELLVALAIFSLAALALVRLQGITVRTAADLDARMMAEIVARNIAAEVETDPSAPTLGAEQGEVENGGRRWIWQRVVARTRDPRLLNIQVRVSGGGGVPVSSTLSFAKAVP